jgi:sterol desaturase/sphingolipid hydroxylase (fatty acid hydroxylase superfamily)
VDAAKYQRRRRRRLIGWLALVVLVGGFAVAVVRSPDGIAGLVPFTPSDAEEGVWKGWVGTLFNPFYIGLVVVLVLLERRFAAVNSAGALTVGGANDLVWLLAFPLTSATLVAVWLRALNSVFFEGLSGQVVDLPDHIGLPLAIVVAFLVGDFLNWFTHWVRHVIPTFWYFHAVHHSQPQMGVLTDFRVHFMEAVIAATLVFIPTQLLGIDGAIGGLLAFSTLYFTAFTHANLRTNLGPLRWVLVTPQFHRVHHGYAPEHIDKNFGTALSVWDRMFRTAYTRDENEYCTTGIHDESFPLTRDASVPEVVGSYVRQNIYPFRQCVADLKTYELGRGKPSPEQQLA